MMWILFFLPAAVCFIVYAILRIKWQRKYRDSAFYNYFEED